MDIGSDSKLSIDDAKKDLLKKVADTTTEKPKKRKRGRPSKKQKEKEKQLEAVQRIEFTGDMVSKLLTIPNATLKARYPEAEFSDEELTAIGTALANVVNKYMPDTLDEYGEEIALLSVISVTCFDKYVKVQQAKQKKEKKDKNA